MVNPGHSTNLYHIQTSVHQGNLLMDHYTTGSGIRDFHFDAYERFFSRWKVPEKSKGVPYAP